MDCVPPDEMLGLRPRTAASADGGKARAKQRATT
jgi:hypothetical protein